MKLSDVLDRARSEPEDRRTLLGRHLCLITGISPALLGLKTDAYENLAAGYRGIVHRPAGGAPRLTAVVLTRNEERTIRGCLESLADDAEGVVLIDAESEDSTVDIANQSFPGITHVTRPWTDDFAAQRNTAFDHIHGDGWLVHVDADETLTRESKGHLRSVLAALDHVVPGVDLVVSPRIVDTSGTIHANTQRVLRVGTEFRFKGRVHERPYDVDGNAPPNVGVAVTFRHTGYEPETMKSKRKPENYTRILNTCLAEEPDNPKWPFYAVRDPLATNALSPAEARAAFHRLQESLDDYKREGVCDYETERHTDTLMLMCDLALRFGGQKEIAETSSALMAEGRTLQASFYSSFVEFSGLLARASGCWTGSRWPVAPTPPPTANSSAASMTCKRSSRSLAAATTRWPPCSPSRAATGAANSPNERSTS